MTFRTEWVADHILGTTFNTSTSVSELNLVMLEYLGAAQEQKVALLLDFSDVLVPNDMLSMPSLLQVINHANTQWLAIVKTETSSSYMTKLLVRDKVKMFRDRQTAIDFLQAMIRIDGYDGFVTASS
ncbi:MAG: hypothetical protein AAFV93_09970 [Chloroflexota bacterium]